jgi:hypothetical protein
MLDYGLHAAAFVQFVLDGVESSRQIAGRGDGPQNSAFPKRHPGLFGARNRLGDRRDDALHHALEVRFGLQRPGDVTERLRHIDQWATSQFGRFLLLILWHLLPLLR